MNVAFLNENTLGHTSYLPRFADEFRARPELGVTVHVLDVLPLPAHLRRWGDTSIRGLRKFGLDFHGTRWRLSISRHAREQLDTLRARARVDAVVVNTQSAGLALEGITRQIPTLVALDATFRQLADSPWFGSHRLTRWLQPLTMGVLFRRERRLIEAATCLLPWSQVAADSLRRHYGVTEERLAILPPSLAAPPPCPPCSKAARPQILFLGGDFNRKGGPLLLEVFRRHFADRAELHLVTQSEVAPEPGVCVHHGVKAGSPEWLERWQTADLFVFPSRLETFGIVLLEALAFEVPIVTSAAGAACDILGDGAFGTLVEPLDAETLRAAMHAALANPARAKALAATGRQAFGQRFLLAKNAERLAELLAAAQARVRK